MGDRSLVLAPSVAGQFYPADAEVLKRDVLGYIDGAGSFPQAGTVRTLVVPHAGYMFSGGVAGAGFAAVREHNPDTVLFLAVSHQGASGACVFPGKGMRTPLGVVEVDVALRDALLNCGAPFHEDQTSFVGEHSIEVNLPFVQTLFPESKILPVLMGRYDEAVSHTVGESIAAVLKARAGSDVLLVVSTDLSHYPAYDEAVALDRETLEQIASMDRDALVQAWAQWGPNREKNIHCRLCGRAPLLSGLDASLALGATRANVLQYLNSGDGPGDRDRVVGYGAVAMLADREAAV